MGRWGYYYIRPHCSCLTFDHRNYYSKVSISSGLYLEIDVVLHQHCRLYPPFRMHTSSISRKHLYIVLVIVLVIVSLLLLHSPIPENLICLPNERSREVALPLLSRI